MYLHISHVLSDVRALCEPTSVKSRTIDAIKENPRTEPERLRRPRGLVQEIVETLAANLREGLIKAGDKLPTESEIMEVARATGNRHFAGLMTYLGSMIIPRARLNTPSSAPEGRLPYLQRVNQEHASIFVAIRNQDAEAARAAMRTHLSNSKERLRESQAQRLGHTMTNYLPGPISA